MTMPLYDKIQTEKPECSGDGNRGLWFERFFDQYDPRNWSVLKPEANYTTQGNTHWLSHHFGGKTAGDKEQLSRHAQSQIEVVANLGGQSLAFQSGRFVTGMGNSHPVENGFAWHPTLGVPYLTGAAVKGLVRGYIETHLDEADPANPEKKQLLLHWFGSTDKDPTSQGYKSQAGELMFFDAVPTEPVTLGVDIMTPHMGKWYEKGGGNDAGKPDAVPADWHAPVPVAFLTAKKIILLFSFALRPYAVTQQRPAIDFSDVETALKNVLEQMGAGGKTATGYGGMQQSTDAMDTLQSALSSQQEDEKRLAMEAEEAATLEAVLAQMNPVEREIAEFPTVLDAIKALENGQWSGEKQQQAAQFLKVRMEQENDWAESTAAKNPKKDKPHQRTLRVLVFL